MSEQPDAVISDEEVERVHANANFGGMTKRQVVNEGVLKYAFGYSCGHTQLTILIEHGLVRKPLLGGSKTTLTQKGFRYLQASTGERFSDIAKLVGAR